MGRLNVMKSGAAIAALAVMATSAHAAQELQFQFTGGPSGTFTFDLSSTPTPFSDPGGYAQYYVTGTADASVYWGPAAGTAPIVFVDIADGFIQVDTATNYYTFVNTPQTPYFTGTYNAPTFAPGVSYHWADATGGDALIITALPEPAAWALMLVGFAGLGGALRASRRSLSDETA